MAIASTLGPQSAKYLIISSEWSHLPPGGHDEDGDGPCLHLSPISNPITDLFLLLLKIAAAWAAILLDNNHFPHLF